MDAKKYDFKYAIGDKVKLIAEVPFYSRNRRANVPFNPDVETTVTGFGWDFTEDKGLTVYYSLDYKENEYLGRENKIPEDNLVETGETHPHTEECFLKMADGTPIEIGQKVYWHIIENYYYKKPPTPNIRFSFAGYGEAVSMHFYKNDPISNEIVKIKREFLCEDENGCQWQDARRFGTIDEDKPKNIYLHIPEDYPEKYVEEVIKDHRPGFPSLLNPSNKNWYFEVKAWLTHIGVYERVMEIYEKRAKEAGIDKEANKLLEEEKQKRTAKLKAIIAGLSDEEKSELKKML